MIKRFINRSSGSDAENGGTSGLSLSELEAMEDGTETIEEEKKPEEEEKIPEEKAPAKLDEKIDEAKKEEEKTVVEEEKEEEEEPAKKEGEESEDEPDDAKDFYDSVNELRGDTLEVDYGTVDPLSPEGVVIRDRVVEDAAISGFEEFLKTSYPRAYAYLNHSMAGLPEEEFFSKATNLDVLPTEDEVLAHVETQKSITMLDLIAKGNSEKHAGLIIKQAIEDNELEELALEALKNRTGAQEKELAAIQAEADKAIKEKENAISEMETFVDDFLATGKIGKVTVPPADRAKFGSEIKKNIRYENGEFVLVSKLNDKNVQEMFGKEYYAYKKGDLGELVEAEAKTQNAVRLKKTIVDKPTLKGGQQSKVKVMTLGEMDAE